MVNIVNISGGLLVFDLKDKTILRIKNKQEVKDIKDENITKHIEHLAKIGLIRMTKIGVKEKKEVG